VGYPVSFEVLLLFVVFFFFALHNSFCEILRFLLPMFDVDIDVAIFSTLKKSV